MKSEYKIINLFCIYTILSITISIFAWAAIGIGLVSIPANYLSNIGAAGWALGCLTYVSGLFMVYRLKKYGNIGILAFAVYPACQAIALTHAYATNGWVYAPSAGSQGTIPALVISMAMFVYLSTKKHRELRLGQ